MPRSAAAQGVCPQPLSPPPRPSSKAALRPHPAPGRWFFLGKGDGAGGADRCSQEWILISLFLSRVRVLVTNNTVARKLDQEIGPRSPWRKAASGEIWVFFFFFCSDFCVQAVLPGPRGKVEVKLEQVAQRARPARLGAARSLAVDGGYACLPGGWGGGIG